MPYRNPARRLLALGLLVLPLSLPLAARAEQASIELSIKDHRFEPAEFKVPANTKVKLLVKNLDQTPEEFESYELKREKVIPGGATVTLFIGPLKPGVYPFFGEFNQATAQGRVIVE